MLDDGAIAFLKAHKVGIGISMDGHTAAVCDRTRATWKGNGVFDRVIRAMDKLRGYDGYNVICTLTSRNIRHAARIVKFFHNSPCGGGRCFFELVPNGDLFPCSEFIGLPEFKGGNLFEHDIPGILESGPFLKAASEDLPQIAVRAARVTGVAPVSFPRVCDIVLRMA